MVYLHDLLGAIWEVLFNLVVRKLEHLKTIWERCLGCLCLCKVVGHFLVWEGLFDVLVVEVDDRVAIWETLTFDTVVEDDFFLAVLVNSLDFAIMTNDLLNDLGVGSCLCVVFLREFEAVIFIILHSLI